MPPAAPLSCRRKRGKTGRGGGFRFPPPTPHPLKRPIRGCGPCWMYPRKEGMPARPERRGRYNVSPRRRKAASRTARGNSKKGNRNSPSWSFQGGWALGRGKIEIPPSQPVLSPLSGRSERGPPEALTRKQVSKRVPMEGAPARHKAGRCRQKVNCLREAKEAAPTVERTAHKTRPVSGPYLRRNTWTRKEARTRRPSRAASRSAPSLGVFQ